VSESGPRFYGWCDEADRVDAFVAALSALTVPDALCNVNIYSIDSSGEPWRERILIDQVIAFTRTFFAAGACVYAFSVIKVSSGNIHGLNVKCFGEGYRRRDPDGPLGASVDDRSAFLVRRMEVVLGSGPRSTAVEAAAVSLQVQADTVDILLRLCAPDDTKRVTAGACSFFMYWVAPVEACATYHADAAMIARDLALSWVHLHDGDKNEVAAGLSLDALSARVEAAPQGARVGVATSVERLEEHLKLDFAATRSWETQPPRPDLARKGPRAVGPGDEELTREQVLKALETSPATLLEALEAAAVPDDEWRAAELLALEAIKAKKRGAPTLEIDVSTGKHRRFIEHHAPYHVRRLPNGGVLLATHPYRTLWKLWADALLLLGIRTD